MHRFFVEKQDFFGDYCHITNSDDIKHMKKSLRIKDGEEIEVAISSKGSEGKEYFGNVDFSLDSSDIILIKNLIEIDIKRESNIKITLFQGLPKADKFEYIIQKSVELGIREIIPVDTERTVVKIEKRKDIERKLDRWNKIAYEASKQSKRTFIPEIKEIIKFNDMISLFNEFDLVLFLYEGEKNVRIKDIILGKEFSNIAVIVGPEGGFSDKEAETISESDGISVSLGNRILRTETAGITCISILQYQLGDIG